MEKLGSVGKGKLLRIVLQVLILLSLGIAAVEFLSGEQLLNALRSTDFQWVPFILLIVTAHLLLKAWRFVIFLEPFTDSVPWFVIVKAYVAGQAATLVPGSVAARAGLMKQVGVPIAQSSAPVAFANGLDQLAFVAGLLVAAFWFEALRTPALMLVGIIAALVFLFAVSGMRQRLAGPADWLAEKLNRESAWNRFLDAVPRLLKPRILLLTSALTSLAFAGKVIALDLSMQSVGLELDYPILLLGYVLPTLLGRLVPIPGGLGVTEVSMIGFLATITPAGTYPLTIGVVVFRISAIFFLASLGAVVYYGMWNGSEEVKAHS